MDVSLPFFFRYFLGKLTNLFPFLIAISGLIIFIDVCFSVVDTGEQFKFSSVIYIFFIFVALKNGLIGDDKRYGWLFKIKHTIETHKRNSYFNKL
jgi:hypothetical protein